MCDPIERAAQRAARLAELHATQTANGDDDHDGDDERTVTSGVRFRVFGSWTISSFPKFGAHAL